MDDITDLPFRNLCKEFGADLIVTEFVAAEAINHEAEKSYRKMRYDESQRPVGIQIFGSEEEALLQCIEAVEAQQPDFIDINWGCPVRKVAGRGAGSGILKDIPKMLRLTASVVRHSRLPVTVKTRLGYDDSDKPIVQLAEQLQDVGVAALSIHGRTKTQMYQGQADWSLIGAVKRNPRVTIPVIGNGDITTPQQAVEAHRRYGVDGILIGRAAIGNPWIFEQTQRLLRGEEERPVGVAERVAVCRRHLLAAAAFKGERTALFEMRKHYGSYFRGLPGFKAFRIPLVSVVTLDEVLALLDRIADHYGDA
ncbi:MAG: hypothetical protein AUK63_1548 [bacterium P3]|nr:MAG: hypothetical protein AUK63_1548 [bacterium P3]KWW41056.1 MAG: hypothetical protein F083_1223 [bacterium F083]